MSEDTTEYMGKDFEIQMKMTNRDYKVILASLALFGQILEGELEGAMKDGDRDVIKELISIRAEYRELMNKWENIEVYHG